MRGTLALCSVRAIARAGLWVVFIASVAVWSAPSFAQDDSDDEGGSYESSEPAFQVNGMMRMQGGVFAPLLSDQFKPHKNLAYAPSPVSGKPSPDFPCDPVAIQTNQCFPVDHGQPAGSPSIARSTFQLEAQWDINDKVGLHTIVRAVRSLRLPADQFAQIPDPQLDPALRKKYAEDWAHDNYYQELDLREFYLDLAPSKFVSFRLGRQQVAWGDTGQYRLLDVVNPSNNTWHFGPLESIEDTRIPLWMAMTTIDMPKIDHSLELLWIPMIDRKKDTVTTPLTFTGAWGLPYPNYPTSFFIQHKEFRYPGHSLNDQRAGLRWKGNLGQHTSYSLVYMYTHQLSPPIPLYYELQATPTGYDSTTASRAVLVYPRQHIAGFTLEQLIDPLGMVARIETAIEPNRTYPGDTRQPYATPVNGNRFYFRQSKEVAINYAVVLQRPTMIRFLNPTQNFLLVAQFMHTYVPTLSTKDVGDQGGLREVPGYNGWAAQKHSLKVIFAARTAYLNGRISLGLTGAWLPNLYAGDSGFYSIDVGFRFGPHYRLNITATDFIGKDP